jgi:hypothetical protein
MTELINESTINSGGGCMTIDIGEKRKSILILQENILLKRRETLNVRCTIFI